MKEIPIATRPQARDAVELLSQKTVLLGICAARRDAQVLGMQQEMASEISAVEKRHLPLIEKLSAEISGLQAKLEVWARENRKAEFGESQSVEFPHGTLQFRKGRRSLDNLAGWDFKRSLKAMLEKASAWRRAIRIKKEINAAQILIDSCANPKTGRGPLLTAEKLRGVGLRVVQGEGFEVELKEVA